jgi:hypothetical protein
MKELIGLVYTVKHHFQQYFSYIVVASFIGGGNQSSKLTNRLKSEWAAEYLFPCTSISQ